MSISSSRRAWGVIVLSITVAVSANVVASPALAAAPSNDDFADATVITALPFTDTVDATDATPDPDDHPYCGYGEHTVWYSFTAPRDVRIKVSATDLVCSYRGTEGSLVSINRSRFDVRAGETVHMMLNAFSPNPSGSLIWTLHVERIVPPPNDDIDDATEVTALPYEDAVDVDFASTEAIDPAPCFGRPQSTVWYRFTPASDLLLDAAAYGDHGDANRPLTLSAFVRRSGSLTEVTCAVEEGAGAVPARIGIEAREGRTLFFMINSVVAAGQTVHFDLRRARLPENDDFADATVIDRPHFSDTADTFWATPEADDPPSTPGCPTIGARTIWYAYSATEDSRVLVQGSGGAVSVIAYAGLRGALTPLACAGEQGATVKVNVPAGKTVHFLVEIYTSYQVFVRALVRPVPPAVNTDLGAATKIASRSLPFTDIAAPPLAKGHRGALANGHGTPGRHDPDCMRAHSTVWYSFTPMRDAWFTASTAGSSYDTVLAAFEPGSRSPHAIACRNDNLSPNPALGYGYVAERLRFRGLEGHTYYVMVGALEEPSIMQLSLS